jgi:hypothetical protein
MSDEAEKPSDDESSGEKLYSVNTDSFDIALTKIVLQYKRQNYPGVGEYKCTFLDGTTVHIKIKDKQSKARK